jgi:hypothetical protein
MAITAIGSTWATLAQALLERRSVRATYHGQVRVLSPHALGWKNGVPKLLAYQLAGTTSTGLLPLDSHQRWRSMVVGEIRNVTMALEPWQTADNYSSHSNCFDQIALDVDGQS